MIDDENVSDELQYILDCAKLADDAWDKQRRRERDDLTYQIPENQVDSATQNDREAQTFQLGSTGMTIPLAKRPTVAVPKLDQPVQLVQNTIRQSNLGILVSAESDDATDDTAEVLQGLMMRILSDPRAEQAIDWASDRATKCGMGNLRVIKRPCAVDPKTPRNDPRWWDQDIVVERILYQESVRWDPNATRADFSDAEWCFIFADMPWVKFKREFPKSKFAKMRPREILQYRSDWEESRAETETAPRWINGDTEASLTIRVAEFFRRHIELEEIEAPDDTGRTRDIEHVTVTWQLINGYEILKESEWDGQEIPIVPAIGRELIPVDGERTWFGIYSTGKGSQRIYNAVSTAMVEAIQTLAKSPYMIAEGQIEGYEDMWAQLAVRAFPALIYRPQSVAGTLVGPPQRNQGDLSTVQSLIVVRDQVNGDIQAATAFQAPSLGEISNNSQKVSGRALLAAQQQGDLSNSNYVDNLSQITYMRLAEIFLDLIPSVYDRPGRIIMPLGEDDERDDLVMINQPYTVQNQKMTPVQPGQDSQGENGKPLPVKHYDLKNARGRYGFAITVGQMPKTLNDQASIMWAEIFKANPQAFLMYGDLFFGAQSFKGHKEAQRRAKKMLPPQLQDQNDGQPDPQQLQQQVQQAGQMIGHLSQELDAKNDFIKTEQAKYQAQLQQADMDNRTKLQLERMRNETTIAVAQINAEKGAGEVVFKEEQARVGMGMQQLHEAAQAHLDRQHEQSMAVHQAAQQAMQADQDHQQSMQQADQQHGQTLEQQAMAGQQAMDQQQQAADLAPEPSGGE